jgi:hypothetical protein
MCIQKRFGHQQFLFGQHCCVTHFIFQIFVHHFSERVIPRKAAKVKGKEMKE